MNLKDVFSFRKADKRAVILLLLIILICMLLYVLKNENKKEIIEYPAQLIIKSDFQEKVDSINTYKEDNGIVVKLKEGKTININTADSITLLRIPQIGATLAQRILEYRRNKGRINKIEELKNIKGIKDKKYAKIIPYLRIDTNEEKSKE